MSTTAITMSTTAATTASTLHTNLQNLFFPERLSNDERSSIVSKTDWMKKGTIVTMIATPIFAFLLPTIFPMFTCGLVGVMLADIYNIADNIHDEHKAFLDGRMQPNNVSTAQSLRDVLFDGTIIAGPIFRYLANNPDNTGNLATLLNRVGMFVS